ncbi:MAG: YaiI/YqxD family protein [Desulfoplanes sp.]
MKLYIDGDAFPNLLKPIIVRAIERLKLTTIVVSNKRIYLGESKHISYIIVGAGPDEADNKIVEMVEEGDLVITADIPLADHIITKNGHAIDHRGGLFTEANIKQYLTMRNFMQEIRDSGERTKGPAPLSQKDAHGFANQLDQFLTKHISR